MREEDQKNQEDQKTNFIIQSFSDTKIKSKDISNLIFLKKIDGQDYDLSNLDLNGLE